jgi:tRNA A-37 threonylcarbamoyl transferase component Bud32
MDEMDVGTFSQMLLKLGLVQPPQMAGAREEAAEAGGDPLVSLRRALERKGLLTPWQCGKILKGDPDGYFLGGYRLLYKISSGSFGRVFRADDPGSGRVVAIKVLRRRWSEDQQKIDLFYREGKVGMTLKHPNIVEVLGVAQDVPSTQYYLVMEFVEGQNLRELLHRRKKLTVAESLRIIDDAASGLAYAYARGVTHRDIKLTNLLISTQGEAKLVDFGLAQMFAHNVKEEEKVDRTVDYAGLERATNVKTGDVRSDLYFLGCVLYESLTGRSPLVMTRDRHQRMRKDRFENVAAIKPEEIDGPPAVLSLVETMMSLNPSRRYQTPSQLIDAVRAVRREVAGKSGQSDGRPATRSIFLAERDEHLQDVLRERFKELGFRVFVAGAPERALERFRQQPYDALVVDAETTGEDGILTFEQVLAEAGRKRLPCAAVLLLHGEQSDWVGRITIPPRAAIMVKPVGWKQLHHKLEELLNHRPD